MRVLELNAAEWKTELDFYHALYAAIGAPKDASCNINALLDYVVWGGMGALEPPYIVRISGLSKASPAVVEDVQYTKDAVAKARVEFNQRKGRDVEVGIETTS